MFDTTSRYFSITTFTLTRPDGQIVAFKGRRFLPQGKSLPLLVETPVVQGDRLDLITTRTLGDPEQYWRICDANDCMNPEDLTSESGHTLRVPIPQA
jgi:hypothetical protein